MTVSRVAAEVDEKLSAFRSRKLDAAAYPYLKVDARYEKVRVDKKVITQAVLVVMGFTHEGKREILDWRLADSESEARWSEMFKGLKDRGLSGVKLLISDAHRGITSAAERHLQGAAWQRCQVHFKRELLAKVSYKKRSELMADVRSIFAGHDATECLRRGEEVAAQVGEDVLERGEDAPRRPGRLPDGAELPGDTPHEADEHEHAGESDEATEEADPRGGRVPEPSELRPPDRRTAAGGSRELAERNASEVQHGVRASVIVRRG